MLDVNHLLIEEIIAEKEVSAESNSRDSSILEEHEHYIAYLSDIIGFENVSGLEWLHADESTEICELTEGSTGFGSTVRINDLPNLNGYLLDVNHRLKQGQYLVIGMETKNTRKKRIFDKFPPIISYPYYLADFAVTRVFAKLSLTKKLYSLISGGKNRVMTLTEGLARLVYAGFKVVDYREINGRTYIVGQKINEPDFNSKPTYGAIVKLPRIGKNGKMIDVYKIRTMHPYSEYLQEYMYNRFGTEDGDKIENDFRKTRWGIFFRKYWIDELPMIWNLLKGDLKLIGVRPLSKHKYDTYPEYLKEKRIKTKPGLIPPYYADLPETQEDFFDTENNYLESYFKNPLRTDVNYFIKAVYNIVIKGHRSK